MFLDDLLNGSRFQTSAPAQRPACCSPGTGASTLADVTVPVRWWHGDEDHIVPFRHGQHLVARLPDATLTDRRREPPRRPRHRRGGPRTLMELGPRRRRAQARSADHWCTQPPHASQWAHNYIRVVRHTRFRSDEPAGEGVARAGDEGGHGDRTHCRPAAATRGVLYVHSAPSALCPHIEWAVGGVLGAAVSLAGPRSRPSPAPTAPSCPGAATPARPPPIASALRGWNHLRFEVTEEPTAGHRGRRATPTRPTSASSTPSPACTATS